MTGSHHARIRPVMQVWALPSEHGAQAGRRVPLQTPPKAPGAAPATGISEEGLQPSAMDAAAHVGDEAPEPTTPRLYGSAGGSVEDAGLSAGSRVQEDEGEDRDDAGKGSGSGTSSPSSPGSPDSPGGVEDDRQSSPIRHPALHTTSTYSPAQRAPTHGLSIEISPPDAHAASYAASPPPPPALPPALLARQRLLRHVQLPGSTGPGSAVAGAAAPSQQPVNAPAAHPYASSPDGYGYGHSAASPPHSPA